MTPVNAPDGFSLVKIGAEFLWVIIAMFGGIARYLDSYIRTGQSPRWGILFAHALVSGFSGYMVAQTVIQFSTQWALVAAGVGGYLGTQGLDWIASVLRDKVVGGTIPPPPPSISENKPSNDKIKEKNL